MAWRGGEMHIYNRIWRWFRQSRSRPAVALMLLVQAVMSVWGTGLPIVPRMLLTILIGLLAYMGKLEERDSMCEGPHPYIPVINTVKTELVYTVLDEIVENVLHFVKTTPWTLTDLATFGAQVKGAWNSNIKQNQSTDCSLIKIRLTDLTTASSPGIEYVTGLPITGTIGNGVENGAQTVATKFLTPGRGRSHRGRAYNVGMPDNTVTNNRITDAYAQDLTDGWEGFRADILGDTLAAIQVVVSYCQGKSWLEEGIPYEVVATSTDVWVDSQRRRLHGRGQ